MFVKWIALSGEKSQLQRWSLIGAAIDPLFSGADLKNLPFSGSFFSEDLLSRQHDAGKMLVAQATDCYMTLVLPE